MTDTTSMTGAEFREHVGTDPAKWAEAFDKEAGRLSAESGGRWPANREDRIVFLTRWFRDYGEAAVAHAQASHQKILAERLVPRQSSE